MYKPCWPLVVIDKVESILTKDMTVFEWGTGYSTLWLAERVKSVITMEHDEKWFNEIKNLSKIQGLDNISFNLVELDSVGYYTVIRSCRPDLIVVDGRNRVNCFYTALDSIKVGGFILLDDSQRSRYNSVFNCRGVDIFCKISGELEDKTIQETTIFRKRG